MSDSEEEAVYRIGYIYQIIDIDFPELFYVGGTVKDPQRRWSEHKCDAVRRNCKLYNHMNLRGHDKFRVRIWEIFEDITKEELRLHEQSYIDFMEPPLNSNRAYRTAEQRREHDRLWHQQNSNRYRCELCDFAAARPSELQRHFNSRKHQRNAESQE